MSSRATSCHNPAAYARGSPVNACAMLNKSPLVSKKLGNVFRRELRKTGWDLPILSSGRMVGDAPPMDSIFAQASELTITETEAEAHGGGGPCGAQDVKRRQRNRQHVVGKR